MASIDRPRKRDTRCLSESLSHARRRHILDILRDSDVPLSLADVAAEIATRELDRSDDTLDWEQQKRIHVSLFHWHIPKLADSGLVEYDRETQTVSLAD